MHVTKRYVVMRNDGLTVFLCSQYDSTARIIVAHIWSVVEAKNTARYPTSTLAANAKRTDCKLPRMTKPNYT